MCTSRMGERWKRSEVGSDKEKVIPDRLKDCMNSVDRDPGRQMRQGLVGSLVVDSCSGSSVVAVVATAARQEFHENHR